MILLSYKIKVFNVKNVNLSKIIDLTNFKYEDRIRIIKAYEEISHLMLEFV